MSEDLTDEQVALVERGGSVLNGLTNVAPGTPGWNVRELARKGVWSLLRKEPSCVPGVLDYYYGPSNVGNEAPTP